VSRVACSHHRGWASESTAGEDTAPSRCLEDLFLDQKRPYMAATLCHLFNPPPTSPRLPTARSPPISLSSIELS
jgi:hypothetical protein